MKTTKVHKWRKRIKWIIPTGIVLIVAMIIAANYTVEHATDALVYKNLTS